MPTPGTGRKEPRWLEQAEVIAFHEEQLAAYGGLGGIRDLAALDAALGRPRNRWAYEETADLADCGAAYGFALARSHPFADGNKRTALVSMGVFLRLNGLDLDAPEAEAVHILLAVAEGKLSERELAAWPRDRTRKLPGAGKVVRERSRASRYRVRARQHR